MSLISHVSEVVVITGASAGVGRATARKFARHGARIALLARGMDGLEATQREVQELGGTAIAIPVEKMRVLLHEADRAAKALLFS